ncbi:hypothetical protein [Azorhizophilus paspali]|uniref:Uncharacterized protein n=1 Tax=Azorhizophilus paspali TaxID=69963 RepID=A0ABV6SH60_AZOPA
MIRSDWNALLTNHETIEAMSPEKLLQVGGAVIQKARAVETNVLAEAGERYHVGALSMLNIGTDGLHQGGQPADALAGTA